uniref:Uncharacterized protein n=1 Tax=Oncorhynchus mykiss TaxID=8022 RepID=A0A8K9WMW2_ONCMY
MNHSGPEKREQKFVLDCIAVSSVALGYEHMRPRLWSVLPGYDARNDPHAARYTTTPSVQRVPQKTTPSVYMGFIIYTGFTSVGLHGIHNQYSILSLHRTGHSREQVSNHSGLMSDIKPLIGYNGRFGFRRNTPNLRRNPSSFGEVTTFQLH